MKRQFCLAALLMFANWLSPVCGWEAASGDDNKPLRQTKVGPRIYKGRVIAPVMTAGGGGAEWLERSDRDETEQPDRVIDALEIAPGSVVADVGAGTGYFSIRIARKIAPDGKVLATDVQPEMLRQLNENMKKTGVRNIDRILATANDAKLPAAKVDLVLMVDVYHELQDPERTMAQLRKSLKDDGRLVLVEYRAEDPDVPIRPEHKTTLRQIRYELEPMGFRLKDVFEFLPHQHVEVFVKDSAQSEDPVVDLSDFPSVRRPGWSGVATAEPFEKAGFEPLFDGIGLDGWTGDETVWRVRDGAIVGRSKGGAEQMVTEKKFEDFEVDLQWRVRGDESSAGVCIRSNPRLCVRLDSGVPHLPGYPQAIALRRTGQVTEDREREIVQATTDLANALVAPGEWNRLIVRCLGKRIAIAINGVRTSEFEVGGRNGAGPLAIQALKGDVEFREIWVRTVQSLAE